MVHWPLHHQKVSSLTNRFGLVGYSVYWILNELIDSTPEKSMTKDQIIKAADKIMQPELALAILSLTEHFYQIDGKYYSELGRKRDLTIDDAQNSLDKAGLSGRGFTRLMQIHSISEKFMMAEFEKWKVYKEGEIFKNDKQIFDQFNYWLWNCKKEKVQKPTTEIDWTKL